MEKSVVEQLGIYELRTLARKVGVSSPTTKKRDELISLILKQVENQDTSNITNKKGRPPKNLSSTDDFFNNLIVQETVSSPKTLVFRSNDFEKDENIESIASGIIEFKDQYYFENMSLVKVFNKIYLDNNFIKENNLSVGDFVEVIAGGMELQTIGKAKVLLKVNYEITNKNLNIDNISFENNINIVSNINQGDRALIKNSGGIIELFNKYDQQIELISKNYRVVYVANNIIPEEYVLFSKSKHLSFTTKFDDDINTQLKNIELVISHMKQLLSYGENIFLVVYNLDEILENLELLYKNNSIEAMDVIKKLLSLGRNIEGNASITVCATCSKELPSIFNKIITKRIG